MKHARIEIKTKYNESLIIGRDGMVHIKRINIWEGNTRVMIDGINRHGKITSGGFMIPLKTMDKIAVKWVKARGLK